MSVDLVTQMVVWVSGWLSVSWLSGRAFPAWPAWPGPVVWLGVRAHRAICGRSE